jgi:ATP-dependent Lon protease
LIEIPHQKDIFPTAALCEIVSVTKSLTQDTYSIVAKAVKRFLISALYTDNDYYEVDGEILKDVGTTSPANSKNLAELKKLLLDSTLYVNKEFKKTAAKIFEDNKNVGDLVDQVAILLTDGDLTRYKLIRHDILSEINVTKRIANLINFIRLDAIDDTTKRQIDQTINDRTNDTLAKQQKEYYLREKIKVTKDELGKINPKENDIAGFRNRLENNPYPENIREKVDYEISKIETNGFSQENAISKSYIE